jgi:hypothetical protein
LALGLWVARSFSSSTPPLNVRGGRSRCGRSPDSVERRRLNEGQTEGQTEGRDRLLTNSHCCGART